MLALVRPALTCMSLFGARELAAWLFWWEFLPVEQRRWWGKVAGAQAASLTLPDAPHVKPLPQQTCFDSLACKTTHHSADSLK